MYPTRIVGPLRVGVRIGQWFIQAYEVMITMICSGCRGTYSCRTVDNIQLGDTVIIPAPQHIPPRIEDIPMSAYTAFLHWAELHYRQGCA